MDCAVPSPSKYQSRQFMLISLLFVMFITGVYAFTTLNATNGIWLMPLDDTYIHFQYARQMANFEPNVYNAGQPPTSGATSFAYPYLLVIGYLIGFTGLSLGIWATLIGALSLWGSINILYRLFVHLSDSHQFATIFALLFGLLGSSTWHFYSGMETSLVMLFTLATLSAFIMNHQRTFIFSATALTLLRPEVGIMAIWATLLMMLRHIANKQYRSIIWLSMPIFALFIQPLSNTLITGTAVASGNQSKSILGMIPADFNLILMRILDNFVTMLTEWLTGYNLIQGWYLPALLPIIAMMTLIWLASQKQHRVIALLILGWWFILSSSVSTLDNAFWHFKRYQMPAIIIFYPLAIWGLSLFLATNNSYFKRIVHTLSVLFIGFSFLISVQFLTYHHANIRYVQAQPYAMAQWLNENTPESAIVAVHDVGMMRYIGNRTTLDIVGLTTPKASSSWRNGPGSVAEFLIVNQPDYIASYGAGHGYGLGLLENTSLYSNELARFEIPIESHLNVALAAEKQAIYQPDWNSITIQSNTSALCENLTRCENDPFLIVNQGGIEQEQQVNYDWQVQLDNGFATEVHDVTYWNSSTSIVDGVRQVQYESFNIPPIESDSFLMLRILPTTSAELKIRVEDITINRVIPNVQGFWIDIPIPISPSDNTRTVIIESDTIYKPASYRLYPANLDVSSNNDFIASYQDDAFALLQYILNKNENQLEITFDWLVNELPQGDYRFFVHLYDDLAQPPIAQYDAYPMNGLLPVGNWLQGTMSETITLDISSITAQDATLAIGFYNPQTNERLMPISNNLSNLDNRLILQTLSIRP